MASKKPAPRKSTPKHPVKDAVSMLMADHKKVKSLFSEFKKIAESKAKAAAARKQEIMDTVCDELTVHTTIEEEIYYPAARAAMPKEDALLNEAEIEHGTCKDLIKEIRDGSAKDAMTCARFTVLGEYIDHHVKEEESDMFPKSRKTKLDLVALRTKMEARKAQLTGVPA